ncbi:MAG: lysophospholipase [Anaerolineales bacterium]|nr:lysophospholipase [Anaerolineales bacterium]
MKTIDWRWTSADGLEMVSHGWVPEGKIRAVIILVHGLGEHVNRYAHVAAAVGRQGYALVGFDLRGHGQSGGQRGHIPAFESFFNDLDAFFPQVDERFPGIPKFLFGHSLGGLIVLTYAPTRHPNVLGVVATGPSLRTAIERQKVKVILAKLLGSLWPTFALASGLDPKSLSRDPQVVQAYLDDPLVHDRLSAAFGKSALNTQALVYRLAPSFPVPVLVMHGSDDQLGFASGSEEWAALVPKEKITLKLWHGLYHELHNEPEREQVFEYLLAWLDRHG